MRDKYVLNVNAGKMPENNFRAIQKQSDNSSKEKATVDVPGCSEDGAQYHARDRKPDTERRWSALQATVNIRW